MSTQVDEFYKKRGSDLLSDLYDSGFIRSDINYESLDKLEEYLGFVLQSSAEMAQKSALLMARHKK